MNETANARASLLMNVMIKTAVRTSVGDLATAFRYEYEVTMAIRVTISREVRRGVCEREMGGRGRGGCPVITFRYEYATTMVAIGVTMFASAQGHRFGPRKKSCIPLATPGRNSTTSIASPVHHT